MGTSGKLALEAKFLWVPTADRIRLLDRFIASLGSSKLTDSRTAGLNPRLRIDLSTWCLLHQQMSSTVIHSNQVRRFDRLDALRGAAVVWMAGFHFCFDLNHLGFIKQNFYLDPFWTLQRTCIVTLFLFCAGLGQAVAVQQGQTWTRFWRRWSQVASCAVLVTAGSILMFPKSFISFGVLHGIALMLIITRCTGSWGRWLWLAGSVALLLPSLIQHSFFDTRWSNWVGLITRKPVTEDYVPLLPWLGVMWWGMAAGQWLLLHAPAVLKGRVPKLLQPLALLGRWSLSFYMVHQPVFIGALMVATALR